MNKRPHDRIVPPGMVSITSSHHVPDPRPAEMKLEVVRSGMVRERVVGCFGVSPTSGKRVGSRHRWDGGTVCQWCHRFRDQVFKLVPIK